MYYSAENAESAEGGCVAIQCSILPLDLSDGCCEREALDGHSAFN